MKPADPVILTIIGVTGDLSRRYLLPALYHLECDNLLPDKFCIVGTSRQDLTIDTLREAAMPFLDQAHLDEQDLSRFFARITTVRTDTSSRDGFKTLDAALNELESQSGMCLVRLFYLAVPPDILGEMLTSIGQSGADKCQHNRTGRVLIEKPFGRDLDSARALGDILESHFSEDQIYRIDHFLAKETVQNVLYFRFHNPLVRDIWNSKFIDHIQITVAEEIGIEGRANFYEQTGAVRDMVQSHLLQLVAITTMAEPTRLGASEIRAAREAVLTGLKPLTPESISSGAVRGQYEGYRHESGNPESLMETFVALKIEVDDDRWRGVPIYLRTGKALERKITEITLVFSGEPKEHTTNYLTIRIQPNEGIALTLLAKKPGLKADTEKIVMDYCYDDTPESAGVIRHDAYEKLLIDAMNGDQTLFPTTAEIMNNWRFVEPLLRAWHGSGEDLLRYKKGSWGPAEATSLLKDEHIDWVAEINNVCTPRFKAQ